MIHRLRVTWQSRQSTPTIRSKTQSIPKINVIRKVQAKVSAPGPLQINKNPKPVIHPLPTNPQKIKINRTNTPTPRAIIKPLVTHAKVPIGPSPIRQKALARGKSLQVNAPTRAVTRPAARSTARSGNVSDAKISSIRGIGSGRILVMIAAGPSVNEVDFTPIKDNSKIDFMCINQPNQQVWPTKYWSFCDHTQYRRNQSIWEAYQGITINSTNVKATRSKQIMVKNRPGKGFCLDITHGYHIGRSSTYASMQVAYYMGYDRVYIFGVDMCADPKTGALHYYGQNPDVSNVNRMSRFAAEAENYQWAGEHLPAETRGRFVFCSDWNPWPFVKLFASLDHKVAIEEILKYASASANRSPMS